MQNKQPITINNQTIYIPDYWDQVQSMPDDPKDSVAYMVQSEYAACVALLFPTDESASLPRTKGALINGVRQYLAENQGLIRVEVEKDYLYTIVKTLKEPSGVQYVLTYQRFYPEFILNVQAFFEESGMTGMRDNAVFGKLRSEGIVGNDEDPFAGWMRDPYDKDWKKGALMNMSELEEFDPYFPGFPLSICREFVSVLTDENGS